jgi:predicted nucleic acid-binding protein
MKVFVDTCSICAAIVSSDTNCQQAQRIFLQLEQQRAMMFTSDYVLAELYTLLHVRAGHHTAVAYMDAFKKSGIQLLLAHTVSPQADPFSADTTCHASVTWIAAALPLSTPAALTMFFPLIPTSASSDSTTW